jgi:hypothetical protein
MLEAEAPAAGHPSVLAWLRSLEHPQLDRRTLQVLLMTVHTLDADEQEAAAEFFQGFAPDKRDLFHPSLLDKEPFWSMFAEDQLLPSSIWVLAQCSSRKEGSSVRVVVC